MKYTLSASGYYARTVGGRTVFAHREIYEKHFGPIPEGYVVHHKDGNKTNNIISNLQAMSATDHLSLHHKGVPKTEEMKKKSSETKKGHKVSEETREKIRQKLSGRKIPQETVEHMCGPREKKYKNVCQFCGKEFMATRKTGIKWCSRSCALRGFRRSKNQLMVK